MAGPVWRQHREASQTCDNCLKKTDVSLQEGEVIEADFHPRLTLCEACYETHRRMITRSAG